MLHFSVCKGHGYGDLLYKKLYRSNMIFVGFITFLCNLYTLSVQALWSYGSPVFICGGRDLYSTALCAL